MARKNPQNQAAKGRHAERQQKALELRKQGWSLRRIADELGVAVSTACEYVQESIAELNAQRLEDTEHYRDFELAKLDALEEAANVVLRKAHVFVSNRGDVVYDTDAQGKPVKVFDDAPTLNAIDVVLRCMARRAKLLGLDAPTKLTDGDGGPPFKVIIGIDPE